MSKVTRKTACHDKFIDYCRARGRYDSVMREYRRNSGVLSGRIRRREKAQRTNAQLARLVAMKSSDDVKEAVKNSAVNKFRNVPRHKRGDNFVDTVFFGDGAVNLRGKGHRGYSKKGIIRALACSIFPGGKRVQVVVFNEWGTSSHCPCGEGDKMKSKRKKEGEGEGDKDKSQPCNGITSDSGTSTTNTNTVNNNDNDNNQPALMQDTRFNVCNACETEWPHDVVSVVNMLQIANAMIKGKGPPTWLSRKEKVVDSNG